ncbi:MAG TPA: DUF4115 domain-containing protein [Bryobacteraceae bacterium]|jgi:hypothetical protein|nr:DUF4115 domain-containing protein [Bryobacteraceae bacterium]
MNRRTEPRFEVYTPAQIILLDDPDRDLSASLTGVSATGVQLLARVELLADQMMVVDVEDHLLLAEVRHSRGSGSRYSISAQRIHTLAKVNQREDATRMEKVKAVIDDFHSHLRAGISLTPQIDGLAEELVTIDPAPPVEPTHEPPAEARTETADQAVACEGVNEDFEPEPLVTFRAIPNANQPVLPHIPVLSGSRFSPASILTTGAIQTRESASPEAAEDETVLRPQLDAKQKHALKSAAILTGVIAGLSVILIELLFLRPFKVSASIFPTRTHAAIVSVPAQPASTPMQPDVSEPGKPRLATITATADTWISACSDGRVVFENVLNSSGSRKIRFSRVAVLHVGNAGGVDIAVDGRPVGPLGTTGMVRVVEMFPDRIHLLPPNQRERAGVCKLP